MKRDTGKCVGDKLQFFTWKERLYVYYAEIEVENLVKQLLEGQEKCGFTVKTTQAIHNEINELKNGKSCPP